MTSGNATGSSAPRGPEIPAEEAARLLGVAPSVLDGWVAQLSFPTALAGEAGVRFPREEIEALRDALPTAHSVEGAVRAAQRSLGR